ncbi:hypothetical protein ELZ88_24785 (plasmid) [Salmonella enterica subsp. enterica serovar Karamoja]|uniref:Uncharacterized protein n=1 Tax=Salmonella enterica subsp. enterica serovar Karamoja TaxID=2500153 RepID=A0A3Q9MPY4_SALET|nr:hypothetical protein ELZ88_24785 [Salmonella enterica subsp. enterica serovar Karamoja]
MVDVLRRHFRQVNDDAVVGAQALKRLPGGTERADDGQIPRHSVIRVAVAVMQQVMGRGVVTKQAVAIRLVMGQFQVRGVRLAGFVAPDLLAG